MCRCNWRSDRCGGLGAGASGEVDRGYLEFSSVEDVDYTDSDKLREQSTESDDLLAAVF